MHRCAGDQYIGSWVEAHRHGKGVMRYASGDRFEGNFMQGYYYGTGKFTWSDGSYYEVHGDGIVCLCLVWRCHGYEL